MALCCPWIGLQSGDTFPQQQVYNYKLFARLEMRVDSYIFSMNNRPISCNMHLFTFRMLCRCHSFLTSCLRWERPGQTDGESSRYMDADRRRVWPKFGFTLLFSIRTRLNNKWTKEELLRNKYSIYDLDEGCRSTAFPTETGSWSVITPNGNIQKWKLLSWIINSGLFNKKQLSPP